MMKKSLILSSLLFATAAIPSFASNVHDSDKNFCSAFMAESITMCKQTGGGSYCNISNYNDMQKLLYMLRSLAPSHTIQAGCVAATNRVHQPQEAQQCYVKWSCYIGERVDSSCINPPGKHC